MPIAEQQEGRAEQDKQAYIRERNTAITSAIENAKAKNARLRLLKERHENYLAERAEDVVSDEL